MLPVYLAKKFSANLLLLNNSMQRTVSITENDLEKKIAELAAAVRKQ